ncbi:MAG: hypothetical protein ACKPKO_40645, partial [Candidatus Fonsibacter sp.]
PLTWLSYANNVLAYDMNRPAGTAYYHKPRGSWKGKKVYALNGGVARIPLITDTDIYVTFEVTEPILFSFYIWLRSWEARLLRDSVYEFADGHERKR